MPSRYEPCGLGQLSAKRYGALPIVRRTGGLAETVASYRQDDGDGDGFSFDDLTPLAIANTVGWAVSTWYDRPDHFAAMRDRAMKDRLTWELIREEVRGPLSVGGGEEGRVSYGRPIRLIMNSGSRISTARMLSRLSSEPSQ